MQVLNPVNNTEFFAIELVGDQSEMVVYLCDGDNREAVITIYSSCKDEYKKLHNFCKIVCASMSLRPQHLEGLTQRVSTLLNST